jgi:8-oxo-dGTP pyrophosphatase MutT (NUDIX family)
MSELRMRRAVRAVILDPAGRTLLVRFAFPDRVVWACPGGGIEPDETPRDAIIRELAEETGLMITDPGPPIWSRSHLIPLFGGLWDGQTEEFYLVRVEAFEPAPRFGAEALAAEFISGLRWWRPRELTAAGADGVLFAPRALPSLLEPLRRGEVPDVPTDVGV